MRLRFEDALELALEEIQQAKDKAEAEMRIQRLLGLVKERKFTEIKRVLNF